MSFFDRLKKGLSRTRGGIVHNINHIFLNYENIDDDFYEELEEIMIMGDVGVQATEHILDDLKRKVRELGLTKPAETREHLMDSIKKEMSVKESTYPFMWTNSVILLVGVNGVGKTTTAGKLAEKCRKEGKKVILAAADTYRAAANEQLEIWAKRANVPFVGGQNGQDPGSVVYDGIQSAKAKEADILIVDTAGRLHNKKNLMNELGKIYKVIQKEYFDVYIETLLVLDATTGQNALSQAKEFAEAANVTGIVLTKLDGTAKGGIVVALSSELGIPVKYIGVGEKVEDLQEFDAGEFINALFDET